MEKFLQNKNPIQTPTHVPTPDTIPNTTAPNNDPTAPPFTEPMIIEDDPAPNKLKSPKKKLMMMCALPRKSLFETQIYGIILLK